MKTQITAKDIGLKNLNNPRYYFDDGNALLSIDLTEDHTIGKYTFKSNTTLFFHRNGNVCLGKLIEGSTIEMIDGKKITVNSNIDVYFNLLGAPVKFTGTEDYYHEKTNVTYDTTKGLVLYADGKIMYGWAYSFDTDIFEFNGGYIRFNTDGRIFTIEQDYHNVEPR